MSRRPRLILTMIVKNEAKVIRRCLESVKPLIAGWSISDTGSTDGTHALIREILRDIPGELIERPWVDFATNRNEAIENGLKFEPDYFLTLDADEEFTTSAGFDIRDATADTVDATFEMVGTTGRWPRKVLFRPHLRYKYVLDETLEQGKTQGLLPACLVKSYTDGARAADGMRAKFERDCEVLRRALEKEPNEPRYWFYLATRLFGAGNYAEALDACRKRVSLESGLLAERGWAQVLAGQCLENLGAPFAEVQAAYLAAWQLNPSRAEPLYALGCVHSARGEHALAEIYAREAQRVPRPNDPLPVDETVYAFRAVELLAGALAEQGKLSEARDLLEKLIVLPQLPDAERPRVAENIALIRETEPEPTGAPSLGPDEQTYENQADAVRRGGLGAFRRLGIEYLASPRAQSLPSPLRWLWVLLVAAFGKWATITGAVATVPVAAWALRPLLGVQPALLLALGSPLLFLAGRRRLQDAPVAALTLAAIGFALRGEPVGLGLTLFALLAIKDAAVLVLPALCAAWLWSDASPVLLAAGVGTGLAGATLALLALFGGLALPMLRAGSKGHATPYTLDNQRGAWHRLLVDLVLVSPVTTLAALFGPGWLLGITAALVGAHLIAPVRNVRLVLAADILLRCAAIAAFGWWIAPALLVDLYIARKLRQVYDPVTAALTSQLGMTR